MVKPPRSDIDPQRVDVATAPRKRRLRVKPEPSGALKAEKPGAHRRALQRPIPPGVMFEPDDEGGYSIASPHSDSDLWELQLASTFSTRSESVIRYFIGSLRDLCGSSWDASNERWKPNETELTAVIAMVQDMRPKTTAEAALAAQAVAVHLCTMRLAKQALNSGGIVMDCDAALMGKLARTYAQQMETLRGMQGKRRTTRQSIKVKKELHQHVHYHHTGGDAGNRGQSHGAPASEPSERSALPSPQSGGEVVRLASRARPRGV